MKISWQEYQMQASEFFRRLGFHTEIEASVAGARAVHKVDVLVSGELHGIQFRWVIECKNWKTNIPKEKVMALANIVQDIGADRGFLLSETGFQSGAIRATAHTNLTLSSIADLKIEAQASLVKDESSGLLIRRDRAHKRLWKLHKLSGDYMSHFMYPMGEIAFIDLAVDEALEEKYPVIYTVTREGERPTAKSWDDLVNKISVLLDRAEQYAEKYEKA
jgi:hypothetical protein